MTEGSGQRLVYRENFHPRERERESLRTPRENTSARVHGTPQLTLVGPRARQLYRVKGESHTQKQHRLGLGRRRRKKHGRKRTCERGDDVQLLEAARPHFMVLCLALQCGRNVMQTVVGVGVGAGLSPFPKRSGPRVWISFELASAEAKIDGQRATPAQEW